MATTARGTSFAQLRAVSRRRTNRSSSHAARGAPDSGRPAKASTSGPGAKEATVEGWGAVLLAIVLAVMAATLLAVLFST